MSTKLSATDLRAEAMLAIGAGSDTTATALSNAMYYLMSQPSSFARLRAELDQASGSPMAYDQLIDPVNLVDLKYLQAVINETLRLQPAVPNGVQRISPANKGDVPLAK
jgi:cytochrome P450